MSRARQIHARPAVRIALAASLLGLGACQSAAPSPGFAISANAPSVAPAIDQDTQLLVINYLIAHGMAESYLMSGRATTPGLLDLVRYDHAALMAVLSHERAPGWSSLSRAEGAVGALMDYTTAMDTSVPRAASRFSKARGATP